MTDFSCLMFMPKDVMIIIWGDQALHFCSTTKFIFFINPRLLFQFSPSILGAGGARTFFCFSSPIQLWWVLCHIAIPISNPTKEDPSCVLCCFTGSEKQISNWVIAFGLQGIPADHLHLWELPVRWSAGCKISLYSV